MFQFWIINFTFLRTFFFGMLYIVIVLHRIAVPNFFGVINAHEGSYRTIFYINRNADTILGSGLRHINKHVDAKRRLLMRGWNSAHCIWFLLLLLLLLVAAYDHQNHNFSIRMWWCRSKYYISILRKTAETFIIYF